MTATDQNSLTMPVGIVIRRVPGVTRWAKWVWKAVSVLPGAGDATWKELRSEGDAVEYHAGTLPLTLFSSDAEAYLHGLSAKTPSLYVVMREAEAKSDAPLDLVLLTASPYEAQDYADTSEEIVEKIDMPAGIVAWVRDFANAHYEYEAFVKRRRNKARVDLVEDGIGDHRISQASDVYRAPKRRGPLH